MSDNKKTHEEKQAEFEAYLNRLTGIMGQKMGESGLLEKIEKAIDERDRTMVVPPWLKD